MNHYYNLIIHNDPEVWSSEEIYIDFPRSRYLEHTVDEIKENFKILNEKTIIKLIELPTLFVVENEEGKTREGKITNIQLLQKNIRINFTFNNKYDLPKGTLNGLKAELDINKLELTRTHWAIKNVDLFLHIENYRLQHKSPSKELIQFRQDGSISTRESETIEFKEKYDEEFKRYLKTIMSFANNKGGYIIFGVSDRLRELSTLDETQKTLFDDLDEAHISDNIEEYCSEEISVSTGWGEYGDKEYCYFEIKEAIKKPIICTKDWESNTSSKNKKKSTFALCNGDIYYRRAGKSAKINHKQLKRIIDGEREKEKKIFVELIGKIATIGAGNIGLLSTADRELNINGKSLTLDEKLIKHLNFIKEGEFVERDGAPAYIIKGEIPGIKSATVISNTIDPNTSHPYEGRNEFIEKFKEKFEKDDKVSFRKKTYTLKYIFSMHFVKDEYIEKNKSLFWCNSKGNDKKYSKELFDKFNEYLEKNSQNQE